MPKIVVEGFGGTLLESVLSKLSKKILQRVCMAKIVAFQKT